MILALVWLLSLLLTPALAVAALPTTLGWYEIPSTTIRPLCPTVATRPDIFTGSTIGCEGVMDNWGGGTFDTSRNRLLMRGGGHNGYRGNEVYALNLRTLTIEQLYVPSDPRPYSEQTPCPSFPGNIGKYADGKPQASHTYNHMAYHAGLDLMFEYEGGGVPCGDFINRTWTMGMASPYTWTDKGQGLLNELNVNLGGFGFSVVYDSTTQRIYGRDTTSLRYYNMSLNTWTEANSSGSIGNFTVGTLDTTRRWYFLLESQNIGTTPKVWYKHDLTQPSPTTQLITITGCNFDSLHYGTGIAYNPVRDRIVVWSGGNTLYLVDPATNTCTTETYTGGPTATSTGMYGRFAYSLESGGFAVCTNVDLNCYFLRIDTPETTDFYKRCTATGVVICDSFDTDASFTAVYDGRAALQPNCQNLIVITRDTTTYRSGGAAMKMRLPDVTSCAVADRAGISGYFWRTLGGQSFTDGQTFYVQWQQRFSPEMISNVDTWHIGASGTSWKQVILHRRNSSCGSIELTMHATPYNSVAEGIYPEVYSDCGTQQAYTSNWPAKSQTNSGPLVEQGDTATTGHNCDFNTDPPTCADYPPNTWVTYYCQFGLGTLNATRNSTIKCYQAVNGGAYTQFVNVTDMPLNNDCAGSTDPDCRAYTWITLTAFMTGLVTAAPEATTWYDELIVSTQPIAAPGTVAAAASSAASASGTITFTGTVRIQ